MAHPPWENPGSATAESSFIHTEAMVILVTSGISSNFLSHSCWILINFKMGVNVAFARCVLQKGVKFADDNITQHIRSTTITGSQWSIKGSHPLANYNYKSSNFRVLRLWSYLASSGPRWFLGNNNCLSTYNPSLSQSLEQCPLWNDHCWPRLDKYDRLWKVFWWQGISWIIHFVTLCYCIDKTKQWNIKLNWVTVFLIDETYPAMTMILNPTETTFTLN